MHKDRWLEQLGIVEKRREQLAEQLQCWRKSRRRVRCLVVHNAKILISIRNSS
jgi:hypothetical protein